jgi:hypothetical protein
MDPVTMCTSKETPSNPSTTSGTPLDMETTLSLVLRPLMLLMLGTATTTEGKKKKKIVFSIYWNNL